MKRTSIKNVLFLTCSALGLSGVALDAAPYYVGDNLTPETSAFLTLKNSPQVESVSKDSGSVTALALNGFYHFDNQFSLAANLPFYMASKDAVGTSSKSNVGNLGVGLLWDQTFSSSKDSIRWGVAAGFDNSMPSSREFAGSVVALSNPTTDFYRYYPSALSFVGKVGGFMSQNFWSAKANASYGWSRISKTSIAGSDKDRYTAGLQTGITFHPSRNLNINAEYNALYALSEYRQAASPSISFLFGRVVGAVFVTLPIDKPSRDLSPVVVGATAGFNI